MHAYITMFSEIPICVVKHYGYERYKLELDEYKERAICIVKAMHQKHDDWKWERLMNAIPEIKIKNLNIFSNVK